MNESASAAEERLYQRAAKAARIVPYRRDYRANAFSFVDSGIEELTGYRSEEFSPRLWDSLVLEIVPTGLYAGLSEEESRAKARRERHAIWQADYRIRHRDGSERWLTCSAADSRDEDGQPIESIGLLSDITLRKKLEAQVVQAQRMETIGILAGGLAHNLNNVLSVILGYAAMLRDRIAQDSESLDSVEQIVSATQRAAGLSRQLLAIAKRKVLQRQKIELFPLIDRIAHDLRTILTSDIRVETRVTDSLPAIWGSELAIEQALMNLCINAREAMPRGGIIAIEANIEELSEVRHAFQGDIPPGHYLCLSVKDTGEGIAAEVMEHMFDVFFTTKHPGEHTGLGLTTARSTVHSHGGYMDVESDVGIGSTFRIYLRTQISPEDPPRERDMGPRAKKGETLLVVDDDQGFLDVMEKVLRRLGYGVLTTTSGHEATKICWDEENRIDLVLLDLVMPGLSGQETINMIRARHPRIPFLIVTASNHERDRASAELEGVRGVLQKPVSIRELAETVRRILDRDM